MPRVRLSGPAQSDIETILAASLERWGAAGRSRYAGLLATALRAIAADAHAPTTRARDDLLEGIRSFHVRYTPGGHGVRTPVHVIYFRAPRPDVIDIVRILHERMDPFQHLHEPPATEKTPRPRRRRR